MENQTKIPVLVSEIGTDTVDHAWLTQNEIQKLDDCETYIIIDPVNSQQFRGGQWIETNAVKLHEQDGMVTVR